MFVFAPAKVADQAGVLVERGKAQATEYVQRGKEVVDRGRAWWEDFVDARRGIRERSERQGSCGRRCRKTCL